jgi:predicted transcriptional regulator
VNHRTVRPQNATPHRRIPVTSVLNALFRVGLGALDMQVLRYLYRLHMRGGRLPEVRYEVIAGELGAHHGSVRRAVRRLEAAGYVTRYEGPCRWDPELGRPTQRANRFLVHAHTLVARANRGKPQVNRGAPKGATDPPKGSGNRTGPPLRAVKLHVPEPPFEPRPSEGAVKALIATVRSALNRTSDVHQSEEP